MRIIAGAAGGRRLKTLPGDNTRPTADRVKEAVFSALTPYLPGSRVLDAFAGSAALGLESLSRGAAEAWFCEQNPAAQRICQANIHDCGLAGAHLLKGETFAVLRRLRREEPDLHFDLVFLDPPYRSELLGQSIAFIMAEGWLADDGIIIAESSSKSPAVPAETLEIIREKKYGDTIVRFYQNKP